MQQMYPILTPIGSGSASAYSSNYTSAPKFDSYTRGYFGTSSPMTMNYDVWKINPASLEQYQS